MHGAGRPLAGAVVRVYQGAFGPDGNRFDDTPDLERTADASGRVLLPRNPFAGASREPGIGVAVLRIAHGGRVWYRFLEASAFNLERWKGNRQDATYTFVLPDPGAPGALAVEGYGRAIAPGDATPDAAEQTDFGRVDVNAGPLTRQFVLRNTGGIAPTVASLRLSGPGAGDFRMVDGLDGARVNPQAIVTFRVQFDPSGVGTRAATVEVATDDPACPMVTFALGGEGVAGGEALPVDAGGPYRIAEGGSPRLAAAAAGPSPTFAWELNGDGRFDDTTGASPSLSWARLVALRLGDGTRGDTVRLRVTAADGRSATVSTTLTVENVTPAVVAGPDARLDIGRTLTRVGRFTDPGPDRWTATVDYGDGTGPWPLALNSDGTFRLDHRYTRAGTFRAVVTVADEDGGRGVGRFNVQVAPPARTPPVVRSCKAVPQGGLLDRLTLTFTEPLARAGLGASGPFALVAPGPDGRFGTRDDRSLALRPAEPSADGRSVALRPAARLRLGGRLRLVAGANGRLGDLAGNALDGDRDGRAGGAFRKDFGA